MRKKIGLLALLFLLLGLFTGMAQASAAKLPFKAAPLSPAFLEYQESLKQKTVKQTDAPSRKAAPGGYIPSPVDLSHLKNADYSAYFAAKAQAQAKPFPVSYDLRVHGAVTQVEDQSPHGTCWAFAAIGSLESVYLKKTGTDLNLSELHLAHYAYMDPVGFTQEEGEHVLDHGGTNNIAVATLARWTGAVLEEKLPYDYETPAGPSSNYPNRLHLQNAFFLASPGEEAAPANQWDSVNDIRKELILSHGGVSIAMGAEKLGDAINLPGYNNLDSWCNLTDTPTDHAVLIVGWDDEYSRENFEAVEGPEGILSRQPSSDGAWLIKNSWGADHFDGGYFWLSYEDDSLEEATVFIAEEAADYGNIYDYDELGWCASLGTDGTDNTGWMANVFTARGAEELKAVSFYTTDANAAYEISVYTGLSDASVPTSGTRAASQTGSQLLAGYHTEELNTPVPLAKGTTFAVVIKMTTPSYHSPLAVEMAVKDYSEDAEFEPGVSFTSSDGTDWDDLYETPATACIKAFTVNSETPAPGTGGGGCDAGAAGVAAILPLWVLLWAGSVKRTGRK